MLLGNGSEVLILDINVLVLLLGREDTKSCEEKSFSVDCSWHSMNANFLQHYHYRYRPLFDDYIKQEERRSDHHQKLASSSRW